MSLLCARKSLIAQSFRRSSFHESFHALLPRLTDSALTVAKLAGGGPAAVSHSTDGGSLRRRPGRNGQEHVHKAD